MNPPNDHISLLLLTHNSAELIPKNFSWLSECPLINEIVVVDDCSTDDTPKIVKNLQTAKLTVVFEKRCLSNDFAAQRNFALAKASNDWILWLDADETPTPKMIRFLNTIHLNPELSYSFQRSDIFLGHQLKHGENGNNRFTRLFHKNHGSFVGMVHEIWQGSGDIKETKQVFLHSTADSLKQFLEKINFYSNIRAKELFDQKTPVSLLQIIFYPIAKFIQDYLLKAGFLDSTPGIIIALSMSFHSFLVRAKLWHLYQQK